MRRTVRVGIVGLGTIARERHLPGLRALGDVSIDAVANSTLASSRAGAREHGIARAYPSWRSLVADPDLDAIVVATWPRLHAPVSIAALDAGRHVLVEGRMAMNAREAARMLEAAERRSDLISMVVPGPLTGWADATVVRLLQSGEIGTLRRVHATWASPRVGPGVEAWRLRRRDSGNNVMALGILYELLARWLGQAHAVVATARLAEPTRPVGDVLVTADIPDDVVVLLEFRDGVSGVVEMASVATAGEPNEIRLRGDAGTLVVDLTARSIERIAPAGTRTPVPVPEHEQRGWQVEHDFVAAIRGEEPPGPNDFRTGLAYMRFTDAVHRSASSGRRIDLPG